MTTAYQDFISSKARLSSADGVDPDTLGLHAALYPFQRHVTAWALTLGRAAIFADCGLGKTMMQLEWAKHVHNATDGDVLIVTPLAVADQTIAEAAKLDMSNMITREMGYAPVQVTNYQRLHHAKPSDYAGIVLDESAIVKDMRGKTRTEIIEFASGLQYRLACTATPAPNDLIELLNHAAYLGVKTVAEALAIWFVNDQTHTQSWRLKGHAHNAFWAWVSTWAMAFRNPQDLGYEQVGFDLEPYAIVEQYSTDPVPADDGSLFATDLGISTVRRVRTATLDDRVRRCAAVVNEDMQPWVVWCETNAESTALTRAIPDAHEVRGSDTLDTKERRLRDFTTGAARVLVTKPSIAGHGLNWQHCARIAFVGVSHSYEQSYQAIRRCWRYGQTQHVDVHLFGSELDAGIRRRVERKEQTAMQIYQNVVARATPDTGTATTDRDLAMGNGWLLALGDSVDTIQNVDTHSVGLSVFSPPFPGMYVYTDDSRDMGNVTSVEQMVEQFAYLTGSDGIQRILMPGRSVLIHITQAVAQKVRDGFVGMRDFRGQLIAMMVAQGWIHYGEITIDKNPQVKAIRTRDNGLMFASLRRDAALMHVAMPDMLLHFRAPGDNAIPVLPDVSNDEWIRWARPVWASSDTDDGGIRETHTLNAADARSPEDERHICPLQLDLIKRVIRLWSNPGETVYSPFAGIGSEGVVALQTGRRFTGGELKRAYWAIACEHLTATAAQGGLFDAPAPGGDPWAMAPEGAPSRVEVVRAETDA